MASPNYTVKDLVFWAGMIGGLAVVFNVMKPMGFHPLITLLCSGAAGMLLGNIGLKVYETMINTDNSSQKPFSDEDDGPTF